MEIKKVEIPAKEEHRGLLSRLVNLNWVCPICGGPRREPYRTFSYDGSRRLGCDGWVKLCGHIDKYSDVRIEAVRNRLNDKEPSNA